MPWTHPHRAMGRGNLNLMGTHSHIHRQLQTLWEAGFYPRASCLPKSSGQVSHRLPHSPPHTCFQLSPGQLGHNPPADVCSGSCSAGLKDTFSVITARPSWDLGVPFHLPEITHTPPSPAASDPSTPERHSCSQAPFLACQVYLLKLLLHLLSPTCTGGLSRWLQTLALARS